MVEGRRPPGARRRTAEGLAQSQQRYAALVEAIDGIVYEADARTFQLTFVSKKAERLLGYPIECWLREPDFLVRHIHPDDRASVVSACTAEVAALRNHTLEYRVLAADGRVVWLRDIATVVVENGQPTKVLGVMVDITSRKHLEEELRQKHKLEAVGRLAGGVAHDFNNLLTIIVGLSDALVPMFAPQDPRLPLIEQINAAGKSGAALVRQLLAFSRQQVFRPQVLDLNAAICALQGLLERLLGEDIALEVRLAPDLGCVRADPSQIEQVLVNLAANARDAMPTGGRLTIATANVQLDRAAAARQRFAGHEGDEVVPGPYVLLTVSDTGVGMDAQTQARVFEPFFTTKERGRGTGLGLATVYGIVEQSRGYISIASEVGHGTTFQIYLPRAAGEAPSAAPVEAAELPATGTETILLVEDDEGVRAFAALALDMFGYRVLSAPSADAALKLASSHAGTIHLLLSDVVLRDANGRELAERLVARRPALKVLFTSGYTDDAIVRYGLDQQGYHFLQKPFTASVLARAVRAALDAPPSTPRVQHGSG